MCGFVGIVSVRPVASEIHLALQALQHRGQDAAGIATMAERGERFHLRRRQGIASQALGADALAALRGTIGIGHVRYPTFGRGQIEDAQPFFYRQPGVLMAHNGQITNYHELRAALRRRSIHLLSNCDVEPALCELADALMAQRPAEHRLEDAVRALEIMCTRVRGGYAIVAVLMLDNEPTLLVVRDPHGLRPAVVGRRAEGDWMAASESVALDVLGFELSFEPRPGEAVFLRAGKDPVRVPLGARSAAPCVFEFVYFARPDSVMEGRSVYDVRLKLGGVLAARFAAKQIAADVVVPVPDTSRPAATAMAEQLGLPLREGFIKNRYSGRTFIMPDARTRERAHRLKLNPLPRELCGRRVVLVDDSIVRGTTLERVVRVLRAAGTAEVHLAIHSPPVRHPCFYGIDMCTERELFARRFEEPLDALEQAAAEALGADSLTYLPCEAIDALFGEARCAACFDGRYPEPLRDPDRRQLQDDRARPRLNGGSEVGP